MRSIYSHHHLSLVGTEKCLSTHQGKGDNGGGDEDENSGDNGAKQEKIDRINELATVSM